MKTPLSQMIEIASPILDAMYDGIAIIDVEGIVQYVNDANTRITGLFPKEVLGRYVTDAVPYSRLLDTIHTGQEQKGVRTRVKNREVLSNIVPLYIDGQLIGALSLFRDVTEVRQLTERLQVAKETIRTIQAQSFEQQGILFGKHPKTVKVWRLAQKVAFLPTTVLLTGESGTGKEVVARYIHNVSERREKPFLAVNCAAIPESLLESELFGYEEGAFSGAKKGGRPGYFEMADGGTLFLDEIGEMSLPLQAKLLRVLQDWSVMRIGGVKEKKINVRLIAATNRNLVEMVQEKIFRHDLYYRLAVFLLELPPLREVKEDIALFAQFFLEKTKDKAGRSELSLSRQAIFKLEKYDFPGNLRELANLIERAVILAEGDVIKACDLQLSKSEHKSQGQREESTDDVAFDREGMTLAELEKTYMSSLLGRISSRTEMAKQLGISRATLYRKLKEYGLDVE